MNQGLKVSISKDVAMVVIIVLSFVTSAFLRNYGVFDHLYDLLRACFTMYAALVFILKRKKSVLWIFTSAMFFFLLFFSTYINHNGEYAPTIKNMGFSVAFCVLVDYYLNKNLLKTISGMRIGLEILMWINLLTVILFPRGLYLVTNEAHASTQNPAFFLGHRNNSVEVLIPLIGLAMLESHMRFGRLNAHTSLLVAASMATVLLTWSANAIVCVALLVAYCFFLYRRELMALFNWWVFFIGSVVVTLLLTVFDILEKFRWLIVGILHKSMTLSTRTLIWERAIKWIPQKPILGFGIENANIKYAKIRAVNSCHNYYLDLLYWGGIVLLIVYLALMFMSMRRVKRIRDEKLRGIIAATFGSYCILWIATPLHRANVAWMFAFWLTVYHLSRSRPLDLRSLGTVTVRIPLAKPEAPAAISSDGD